MAATSDTDQELTEIRRSVAALCAGFPGEYWRKKDAERAYPTEFVQALTDAADEDRATGGVDVERGIYPIVAFVSKSGIEFAQDAEIADIYRDIMERRRSRGAGS